MALDANRGDCDSVLGNFDVRHDAGAEFHAQRRDDAGAGVNGRRRYRRRDRSIGKHLSLRRRETHYANARRERGDRRHRSRGDGDDFFAGRDLSAGVFHVVDFRAISVSVRYHRGRRRAGLAAGVVYADADDERAFAARRRCRGRTRWTSRHGFFGRIPPWFLCANRSLVHLAAATGNAPPRGRGRNCHRGRAVQHPALSRSETGVHTHRR